MRRRLRLPIATLLAVGSSLAAHVPPAGADVVHEITFPVRGEVQWTDTYGEPRSGGRSHEGQDLIGDKGQELLAAADGEITYLKADGALSGGMVQLTADDGWVYGYLHLNNDTPGTDDGAASPELMFGPGIELGAEVEAGDVVGYLGDSGNAESTVPHLHFEMESPEGEVVDPGPSLRAARGEDVPAEDEPEDPDEQREAGSPIPRLAGSDRVATAVAVSRAGWPTGSDEVVLAAGDRYAEALPASVLAAARSGPLLLSLGSSLSRGLAAELRRLDASRVAVVGSVPKAVADAVAATGRTVERIGVADDAPSTAVAVAAAVGGSAGTAVLVNGDRFADGVSATSVAAGRGWPVLLSGASTIPQRTVDAWRALGVRRIVVVGGTSVISEKAETFIRTSGGCAGEAGCAVERLAGPDRYATSVAVAERSLGEGGRSLRDVLLGTGTAYPDVLASGPLAARKGGLTLLVDGTGSGADGASHRYLAAKADAMGDVAILGGTGAVTATADRALQSVLGRR